MKTLTEKITELIGSAVALACLTVLCLFGFNAHGQGSPGVGTGGGGSTAYTLTQIPLPVATMTNNVAGVSAGTVTNFYFGYTNFTYFTNIYGPTYTNNLTNSGAPGFIFVTNVVTNATVTYPSVFFPRQSRLALEYNGQCSGSGAGSNLVLTFARSVTGFNGKEDQESQFNWAFSVGNTNTTAETNLPADFLGGAGYLYLIQMQWLATNGVVGGVLTNNYLYSALKPNAP
jgi:hypothetical protein